jgi:hypothetical protein
LIVEHPEFRNFFQTRSTHTGQQTMFF